MKTRPLNPSRLLDDMKHICSRDKANVDVVRSASRDCREDHFRGGRSQAESEKLHDATSRHPAVFSRGLGRQSVTRVSCRKQNVTSVAGHIVLLSVLDSGVQNSEEGQR